MCTSSTSLLGELQTSDMIMCSEAKMSTGGWGKCAGALLPRGHEAGFTYEGLRLRSPLSLMLYFKWLTLLPLSVSLGIASPKGLVPQRVARRDVVELEILTTARLPFAMECHGQGALIANVHRRFLTDQSLFLSLISFLLIVPFPPDSRTKPL